MSNEKGQAFIDLGDEVEVVVKYLQAGIRLVYDVYDDDGKQVHPSHTPFTQKKINELLTTGVESLYYSKIKKILKSQVSDKLTKYLDQETYKGKRSIRAETQKKGICAMEQIVSMVKNEEEIEFKESKNFIDMVFHDMKNSKTEVINLMALEVYDDEAYIHSINTGIIAMVLAKHLKLSEKQIKEVGLGGFLHDIGKLKIPFTLLSKKEKLDRNEFSTLRKHAVFGFELIKDNPTIPDSVKDMVLLHHEKLDGTGYPFHFKENDISQEVSIVALAEAFDSMTSDHPYRTALSSHETMQRLMETAGIHFKTDLTHFFVRNMNCLLKENYYTPVGSFVLLNTQEVARVVAENEDMPILPKIEIVIQKGKALTKPISVDLKMYGSRYIVRPIKESELGSV